MKLTGKLKDRITEDWARLLPGLGIYKPMRLLRRTGPLLSGICLERDSGNEAYRPTFHVHVLAEAFPTVSLTLAHYLLTEKTRAPETIRATFHEQRYAAACARLQRQAPLPLAGSLSCVQVLRAYREYMQTPIGKCSELLYEDMIAILVWCGQLERATASLREFVKDVRSWPAHVLADIPSGIDGFIQRCRSWIDNPSALRTNVEREVVKLEADHLPVADFVCD